MVVLRSTSLVLLLLLGACASTPEPRQPVESRHTRRSSDAISTANDILFRAMALVGTPYRYGGNTPAGGFDCSGFVGYVYRDSNGISLPRTSADIGEIRARKLSLGELESGDLVFFASGRTISHVGIYVGDGRFVHAPNRGGTVRLDLIDSPGWKETFRMGKRLIE